ncbi:MAG TPA: glycosyltransferase family 4 protein [Gemmatimonadaceae bacterium]|nr:glycosyltransferase family 4 protein [Gemmatimonadaceae bacterium]
MSASSGPLRVALASDWYLPRVGGIELQVADLAAALRAAGHGVTVITSTPGADDDPAVVRLNVARLPGSGVAISPRLLARLRETLAAGAYDAVHAHVSVVSPIAYGAVLAARALGLPTVVTFHSVLHASARALAVADRLLHWRRWPLAVTAVSDHVAGQLARAMPGLRVGVLPNGVARAAWGAGPRMPPGGALHVVSAMRLHRKKRPMALVEAIDGAQRALGPGAVRCTIFGDGPERAPVARAIARRGLGDVVTLAGEQPRTSLASAYRSAQAFVLPTIREAFGIAALEARCAGLPVVAMRRSGVASFIEHGRNGLLVDDDAGLAGAIARLARERGLLHTLSLDDARCAIFDWPAVVARHVACYEAAIEVAGVSGAGAALLARVGALGAN